MVVPNESDSVRAHKGTASVATLEGTFLVVHQVVTVQSSAVSETGTTLQTPPLALTAVQAIRVTVQLGTIVSLVNFGQFGRSDDHIFDPNLPGLEADVSFTVKVVASKRSQVMSLQLVFGQRVGTRKVQVALRTQQTELTVLGRLGGGLCGAGTLIAHFRFHFIFNTITITNTNLIANGRRQRPLSHLRYAILTNSNQSFRSVRLLGWVSR